MHKGFIINLLKKQHYSKQKLKMHVHFLEFAETQTNLL